MPPKRKPTGDDESDRPSKKPKSTPRHDAEEEEDEEEEETTAALQQKNKDKYILIGGDESPPVLGTEAPQKLTMQFQRKDTGKREPALTFRKHLSPPLSWHNKSHIAEIQKWRRQNLRRHGFPLQRDMAAWQPLEESFLFLFWHLLARRVAGGVRVRKPSPAVVRDAFNAFFVGRRIRDRLGNLLPPRERREADSVASKLKQGKNGLGDLVTEAKRGMCLSRSVEYWVPSITARMLDRYVRLGIFDDEEDDDDDDAEGEEDAPEEEQEGVDKNDDGVEDTVDRTTDKKQPTTPASSSTETPTTPTDIQELTNMLNARWSIPTLSPDPTETTTHPHNENPDTLPDPWMHTAASAFDARWSRTKNNAFGYKPLPPMDTKWTNYSAAQKRATWYQDRLPLPPSTSSSLSSSSSTPVDEIDAHRREGAAAVNALLGLAVVPPVGYAGDVAALVESVGARLQRFDRAVARESRRVLDVQRDRHDAQFSKYYKF